MSAPVFNAPRYQLELAYSGSNVEYVGYAEPGIKTSEDGWAIFKLLYSGSNIVSLRWANGNRRFDKVWDDHATYTYTL